MNRFINFFEFIFTFREKDELGGGDLVEMNLVVVIWWKHGEGLDLCLVVVVVAGDGGGAVEVMIQMVEELFLLFNLIKFMNFNAFNIYNFNVFY